MARMHPAVLFAGLLLAVSWSALAGSATVADGIDTAQVGYISQFGNELDTAGWLGLDAPVNYSQVSYLHEGMLRAPTGNLYPYPPLAAPEHSLADSGWTYSGHVDIGWQHVYGDSHALFFQRYASWSTGWVLGLLDLEFRNAKTGAYVNVRASRVSKDNDYVRLSAGRYGHYKITAFYRDIPYVQSTQAYPIWEGVGTEHLTLPSSLTPGASTPAQVAAVSAAASRTDIGTTRSRAGLSYEGVLYRNWVGSASITNEERNGTQLWGGSMFFSDTQETIRPVDTSTTDIDLSLRNVGKLWHFLASYNGSFFRDNKDYLTYESPFVLVNYSGNTLLNPFYHLISAEPQPRKFVAWRSIGSGQGLQAIMA